MDKKTFQIAIDGPVAAGKGTTAKLVAQRLGFLYVDTGAMYRALTLFVQRAGVDLTDEEKVVEVLLKNMPKVELRVPDDVEKDGRLCTVLLNNEDVSWKVRAEEVSKGVSVITQYAGVRNMITPLAQQIAQKQSVVMEGRDITSVVLPQADMLIYMDADAMERAKRRHRELLMRGEDITLETVYEDLVERDERDSHREIAPLKKVPGAWVLDTTGMTIDRVAEVIVDKVKELV
ncbi:(d)CMP kinase [Candidatus Woesebacteria bacterium]|nr:(d)CMP kinase [Candidatus Woesebacteria bacterium]